MGAHEVASAQHRKRIVGERRQHIRTVRSAARWRNRPRGWLAWLLVAILALIIVSAVRANAGVVSAAADVARGNASADPAAIANAMRYADAITGRDLDQLARERDEAIDDDDDRDDDDRDDGNRDDDNRDHDDRDDDDRDDDELTDDRRDHADDRDDNGFDDGEPDDDREDRVRISERAGDEPLSSSANMSLAQTGFAAGAGGTERYESLLRQQAPSRWGRLDLGVSWRRRWSEPTRTTPRRYDEVWLIATWRR